MRRQASGPAWISSSSVGGFALDDWLAARRAASKTWSPRTTPRRSVRSVGKENVTYLMIGSSSEVEFYMQCQRSRPPRGQRPRRIFSAICDLCPLCAARIHRRSKTLDRLRFAVVICNISVLTCLFHLLSSPAVYALFS